MSYSSTILTDTPIAYYRLNETSGVVAHDLTGDGYDAAFVGATLNQTGPFIRDGASALFTASGGLIFPFTLDYTAFSLFSLEFWINIASSWNYIVVTSDDSTTTLYKNSLVYSPDPSASIEVSSLFDYAGSYLTGNISEVALYNAVLTPAQIQAHYLAGVLTGCILSPSVSRRDGTAPSTIRRDGSGPSTTRRDGTTPSTDRRTGIAPSTTRR